MQPGFVRLRPPTNAFFPCCPGGWGWSPPCLGKEVCTAVPAQWQHIPTAGFLAVGCKPPWEAAVQLWGSCVWLLERLRYIFPGIKGDISVKLGNLGGDSYETSQAVYSEQGLRHGNGEQGTCYFSFNSNLAVKPIAKFEYKSHVWVPCCHCLPVTDSKAN